MTLAELDRAISSKNRIKKLQAQEKASSDYILADLIGRSISRIYHSANRMPDISEIYPTLFNTKEVERQKKVKKDELSAIRFRQFAQSYNKRFTQEVAKNE